MMIAKWQGLCIFCLLELKKIWWMAWLVFSSFQFSYIRDVGHRRTQHLHHHSCPIPPDLLYGSHLRLPLPQQDPHLQVLCGQGQDRGWHPWQELCAIGTAPQRARHPHATSQRPWNRCPWNPKCPSFKPRPPSWRKTTGVLWDGGASGNRRSGDTDQERVGYRFYRT